LSLNLLLAEIEQSLHPINTQGFGNGVYYILILFKLDKALVLSVVFECLAYWSCDCPRRVLVRVTLENWDPYLSWCTQLQSPFLFYFAFIFADVAMHWCLSFGHIQ